MEGFLCYVNYVFFVLIKGWYKRFLQVWEKCFFGYDLLCYLGYFV